MARYRKPEPPTEWPAELARFRPSEWIDPTEAVPEAELERARYSGQPFDEWLWRAVRGFRRYQEAKRRHATPPPPRPPSGDAA